MRGKKPEGPRHLRRRWLGRGLQGHGELASKSTREDVPSDRFAAPPAAARSTNVASHSVSADCVAGVAGIRHRPGVSGAGQQGNRLLARVPEQLHRRHPELSLFITGDTATTGTVEIPGLSFTSPFTVTPGSVTTVVLPPEAMLTATDGVEDARHPRHRRRRGDRLRTQPDPVHDRRLPRPAHRHPRHRLRRARPGRTSRLVNGTEFAVVATQDGTTVTITPTVTDGGHTPAPRTPSPQPGPDVPTASADRRGPTCRGRSSPRTSRSPCSAAISAPTSRTATPSLATTSSSRCRRPPRGARASSPSRWPRALNGDTFRILASADNTHGVDQRRHGRDAQPRPVPRADHRRPRP